VIFKKGIALFTLIALCFLAFVPSGQAESLPRIMYVTPDYERNGLAQSFLGNYWMLGMAFTGFAGGLSGPSIRYGFGDTGKKLNVSYLVGNSTASWEAGISYIKQDVDATLLVNEKRKGYALELALRLNIASLIVVKTKTDTSIEVGIGF
jgi:hypothetical protein